MKKVNDKKMNTISENADLQNNTTMWNENNERRTKDLHISNIPKWASKSDIVKIFSKYGEVYCRFISRPFGADFAYCFVSFTRDEDSERALQAGRNSQIKFDNETLHVNYGFRSNDNKGVKFKKERNVEISVPEKKTSTKLKNSNGAFEKNERCRIILKNDHSVANNDKQKYNYQKQMEIKEKTFFHQEKNIAKPRTINRLGQKKNIESVFRKNEHSKIVLENENLVVNNDQPINNYQKQMQIEEKTIFHGEKNIAKPRTMNQLGQKKNMRSAFGKNEHCKIVIENEGLVVNNDKPRYNIQKNMEIEGKKNFIEEKRVAKLRTINQLAKKKYTRGTLNKFGNSEIGFKEENLKVESNEKFPEKRKWLKKRFHPDFFENEYLQRANEDPKIAIENNFPSINYIELKDNEKNEWKNGEKKLTKSAFYKENAGADPKRPVESCGNPKIWFKDNIIYDRNKQMKFQDKPKKKEIKNFQSAFIHGFIREESAGSQAAGFEVKNKIPHNRRFIYNGTWGTKSETVGKEFFFEHKKMKPEIINTFARKDYGKKSIETCENMEIRNENVVIKDFKSRVFYNKNNNKIFESNENKEISKIIKRRKEVTESDFIFIKPLDEVKQKKMNKKGKLKKKRKKKIKEPAFINMLDDDCLIEIFMYLPIEQRVNIEKVCVRWRYVSQKAWNDIKDLKIVKKSGVRISVYQEILRLEFLHKVLARCGRFLNTLTITSVCTSDILRSIEHCDNLTKIELEFTKCYIKHFTTFKHMKNLQSFKLTNTNILFTGDCFLTLPENIKSIHITLSSDCSQLPMNILPNNLSASFERFNALHSLTMRGYTFSEVLIKAISEVQTIVQLDLALCEIESGIDFLTDLENLEELDLHQVFAVDDFFLSNLSRKCQKLRFLYINSCRQVNDESLKDVMRNCEELERLKVGDTRITNNSLRFAIDATKLRRNKILRVDAGELAMKFPNSENYSRCLSFTFRKF